jgi:hypothetical protein
MCGIDFLGVYQVTESVEWQKSRVGDDVTIRVERKRTEQKRRTTMEGQVIVALAIAIPVILFPAAFVWYLNIGGVFQAVREARTRKVAEKATTK